MAVGSKNVFVTMSSPYPTINQLPTELSDIWDVIGEPWLDLDECMAMEQFGSFLTRGGRDSGSARFIGLPG